MKSQKILNFFPQYWGNFWLKGKFNELNFSPSTGEIIFSSPNLTSIRLKPTLTEVGFDIIITLPHPSPPLPHWISLRLHFTKILDYFKQLSKIVFFKIHLQFWCCLHFLLIFNFKVVKILGIIFIFDFIIKSCL